MRSQVKNVMAEGYKKTELGMFPDTWNIASIGEIFNVKQGKQLSSRESREGKIQKPFLRTSNIFWDRIDITKVDSMFFTKEEFDTLQLIDGDILVCEGGDIGRTAIYRSELAETAYQNHLHRLRPKRDNICKEFFVFWMHHAITQQQMYVSIANRTTIPNLSASRLKNFIFPYPPIIEQKNISLVLSTIINAKQKNESSIFAYIELKKTLIKHLFTFGPVSKEDAEKVKLKETDVGVIPEHWDIDILGNIFKLTSGKTRPQELLPSPLGNYIYPVYGGNGVMGYSYEKLIDFITIVLGRVGAYCGSVYLTSGASWVSDNALYAKKFMKSIDKEYLTIILRRLELNKLKRTGAQPLISQSIVNMEAIPVPPLVSQKQIASILSAVDAKIQALENKHNALNELFKSMLHNLMTAKIRVNNLEVEDG